MKTGQKKLIIKRKSHSESYDEKKVFASVYAAAIVAERGEKKAESLANNIARAVTKWINKEARKKREISSLDIKEQVLKNLKDKDVLILYKHHLDLC